MKGQPINLVGQRFGRLTVIDMASKSPSGRTWLVKCDCGNERVIRTGKLRSGEHQSCGCLRVERMRARAVVMRKHIVDGGIECHDCGLSKPVSEFSANSKTFSKLSSRCRRCQNIRSVARYTGGNISEAKHWFDLRETSCCEVCQSSADLNVDHSHVTGIIRGILCGNCNRALGLLQEDSARIRSLYAYVEKHS